MPRFTIEHAGANGWEPLTPAASWEEAQEFCLRGQRVVDALWKASTYRKPDDSFSPWRHLTTEELAPQPTKKSL